MTFEGVVISQTLYDHYYHNSKFIPVIPENGSLDHVPLPLKAYSCYFLPVDYDKLYRVLTGQAEHVAPPLGPIRKMPTANAQTPLCIYSDRLPTVKGEFFDRAEELKLLDDAWAGNGTRIIQFIAPGGTGKTKLLRHWLDHTDNIDALIAWSFYSQGLSEDKQVSASPFFRYVLEKLIPLAPRLRERKTEANTWPSCCVGSVTCWCWMGWNHCNMRAKVCAVNSRTEQFGNC